MPAILLLVDPQQVLFIFGNDDESVQRSGDLDLRNKAEPAMQIEFGRRRHENLLPAVQGEDRRAVFDDRLRVGDLRRVAASGEIGD